MATYIISDIHGCYDTFIKLIKKIKFSDNDKLYVLGDIIDRGPKSYELFKWIKNNDNVFMLLGNHEKMFIENMDTLLKINDFSLMSQEEQTNAIKTRLKKVKIYGYDHYGTISKILEKFSANELIEMNTFFKNLPLYFEININNKKWLLVHACCKKDLENMSEDDFLWDRDLAIKGYGFPNKNIIFGHTPTISDLYNNEGYIQEEEISFKNSKCLKINIDCGCVWKHKNSRLGILCLDNMKCFYEKNID